MFCKFAKLDDILFSQLIDVYEESILSEAKGRRYLHDQNSARLLAEQDFYIYLREVFYTTKGAWYAVWIEKGVYRCAVRIEPYQDGFLIAGLETTPRYRRMGYAKNLIMAVLREVDKPVYSHIDKRNLASVELHKSCGFERIKESAVYLDGSVVGTSFTFCRRPTEQ